MSFLSVKEPLKGALQVVLKRENFKEQIEKQFKEQIKMHFKLYFQDYLISIKTFSGALLGPLKGTL